MSDEHLLARKFTTDLDRLVLHPEMFMADTKDEEFTNLLMLARHLMGFDFSTEACAGEVMKRIANSVGQSADLANDEYGELSEDELDNVTAAGDACEFWIDLDKKD